MRARGDCHSESNGKIVLVRVRGDCFSESKKNCHIESKRILYYVIVLVRVRRDRLSEGKKNCHSESTKRPS